MPTFHLILITVRRVTDLEQVVEHCAGALPHEHDEAAEVDGDADRGEAHDDIPGGDGMERVRKEKKSNQRRGRRKLWDCDLENQIHPTTSREFGLPSLIIKYCDYSSPRVLSKVSL